MLFEDKMDMLGHIRTVKVIVVLYASLIFIIDLREKLEEFVVVHSLQEIVLL